MEARRRDHSWRLCTAALYLPLGHAHWVIVFLVESNFLQMREKDTEKVNKRAEIPKSLVVSHTRTQPHFEIH